MGPGLFGRHQLRTDRHWCCWQSEEPPERSQSLPSARWSVVAEKKIVKILLSLFWSKNILLSINEIRLDAAEIHISPLPTPQFCIFAYKSISCHYIQKAAKMINNKLLGMVYSLISLQFGMYFFFSFSSNHNYFLKKWDVIPGDSCMLNYVTFDMLIIPNFFMAERFLSFVKLLQRHVSHFLNIPEQHVITCIFSKTDIIIFF